MLQVRLIIGKLIGIVSGSIAALMWTQAMWMGGIEWSQPIPVFFVAIVMLVLSIAVVIASVREHHRALVILFAISFFPIGLYLFTVDHWINWIGAMNIGFLLAGVLMWKTQDAGSAVTK